STAALPDPHGAFGHTGGQGLMSLFSVLSVGASGMAAQRMRAEMLVENIANAETTGTPGGGPYRRKDVVFESTPVASPFASIFNSQVQDAGGVAVSEVVTAMSGPERRFMPGHRAADEHARSGFP